MQGPGFCLWRLAVGLLCGSLARGAYTFMPLLNLPPRDGPLPLQLCAEQDGVRFGTSQALRSIIRTCLTDDLIKAAAAATASSAGGLPPAASVVSAIAGTWGGCSRYTGWL